MTLMDAREKFPVGCCVTMYHPRIRCPYVFEVTGHVLEYGVPVLEIKSLMWKVNGPPTLPACDAVRIGSAP